MNPRAIANVLNFSANLGPETIFIGAQRLSPGCVLIASEGRLPEPARRLARRVARRGTQLAAVAAGTLVALVALAAIATIALVAAVL